MSGRKRHAEDCFACRMDALELTDEQVEFVTEAMFEALQVGAAAGRGFLKDPAAQPDRNQIQFMIDTASLAWANRWGTPKTVPESDEVRHHAHTKGPHQ